MELAEAVKSVQGLLDEGYKFVYDDRHHRVVAEMYDDEDADMADIIIVVATVPINSLVDDHCIGKLIAEKLNNLSK